MQKHIYQLRNDLDESEWRAKARRKLIVQLIKQYSPHPRSVLDFGCGTGVLVKELMRNFPNSLICGVDNSPEAVKFCIQRNLKNVKFYDGKKLPYAAGSFDVITAIDVIEHIENDLFALKEIRRILKPAGTAVFFVPAHHTLWSTRDIRLKHFRRYEVGELEKKSLMCGLKSLTSKNVDFVLFFALSLICSLAKKKNGIKDLKTDVTNPHPIVNEILYRYCLIENLIQKWSTFFVGTTIAVVVRKNE